VSGVIYGLEVTDSTNPADNVPWEVDGATVNIEFGDPETTTDSNGRYKLTGIPVGSVTVWAFKSDYESNFREVTIKAGQEVENIDITIKSLKPRETTPTPCPFIICLPFTIPTAVPNNPNFDNPYLEP